MIILPFSASAAGTSGGPLSSGVEVNLSTPLKSSFPYRGGVAPAAHIRYFVMDNVSLGGFARHEQQMYRDRSSLGPSIRAYFLRAGAMRLNFTQTFALTNDSSPYRFADGSGNKLWIQTIARMGMEVEITRNLALGLDLTNVSGRSNSAYYEWRSSLNYHFGNDETAYGSDSSTDDDWGLGDISSPQYRFGSKSIGHLVSSNASTLPQNSGSFGTLYTGYGITDNWSVAISPFAYLLFNMASAFSRVGFDVSENSRIGFEVSHYKTIDNPEADPYFYGEGYDSFKMEASAVKATFASLLTKVYRFSVTGSYYHYFDEERPFSLRMDPQNSDPFAANITTLHEIKLNRYFYLNGEFGFWGLNYRFPYYHAGGTLNFQRKNTFLGIGFSTTFSPSFPQERARFFAGYDSRQSIHPELQAQIFF